MEESAADIRGAVDAPEGSVPDWAVRYDAREYPRQAVTGDAVALALDRRGGRTALQALVVERGAEPFAGLDAWPGGFMDWEDDADSLQAAVRELREETGLAAPDYVEPLGSYSRFGRDPRQFAGFRDPGTGEWVSRGARITTSAYLMLVGAEGRASPALAGGDDAAGARWTDVYDYFPWEDLRAPQGWASARAVLASLERWARERGGDRAERVASAFGVGFSQWNEERVPERFALVLEAGLAPEARRDRWGRVEARPDDARYGRPMAFDHRVMMADALGRLRGKIKYHPAALRALTGDGFTLDELQAACEAIAGRPLHRANFRRAVAESREEARRTRTPRIVAGTGQRRPRAPGEPGVDPELYRFRADAVRARLETSLRLPWLPVDAGEGAGRGEDS